MPYSQNAGRFGRVRPHATANTYRSGRPTRSAVGFRRMARLVKTPDRTRSVQRSDSVQRVAKRTPRTEASTIVPSGWNVAVYHAVIGLTAAKAPAQNAAAGPRARRATAAIAKTRPKLASRGRSAGRSSYGPTSL
jgi:hypothetical protein